jgi:DNA-binding XRE family transcriptional regulator
MKPHKLHEWNDVKKELLPPADLTRVEARARETALGLRLRALRLAAGATQAELAGKIQITQAQLSRFESRDDHKLSTMARYVAALGGRLVVTAVIGKQKVPLVGA